MKIIHALAGALALATNRTVVATVIGGLYLGAGFVSPAAAQVAAPSALEWSDARKGSFVGTWTCVAFNSFGDLNGSGYCTGFLVLKRTA